MTLLHQSRTTCLLCGSSDLEDGYEAPVYAGAAFGWVTARNVLCRECGFMFRNPMPEASSLRKYYAGSSDASGSVFHEDGEGSPHHSKQKKRAMFFLENGSPAAERRSLRSAARPESSSSSCRVPSDASGSNRALRPR